MPLLQFLRRQPTNHSIRANCWFCNQDSTIPTSEVDSWSCPKCDQYNGFTKDGDYNRDVTTKQQGGFVDSLGSPMSQYTYAAPGRYTGQPSLRNQPLLCEKCNRNQLTKIRELNSFESSRESGFEAELEKHRHKLDEKYKLCPSCRKIVSDHLKTQALDLKTFLLGNHLQQTRTTPTKVLQKSMSPIHLSLLLAQLLCVTLGSLLVCSDSLSKDITCDGLHSFSWNVSGPPLWSSISGANITSLTKSLVQQLLQLASSSGRGIIITTWENSATAGICLCSKTRRRYLHVALLCLLLQVLIFVGRKTRVGLIILFCWTSLCLLRVWEVFWVHADTRWRVTAVIVCWVLSASSLLFSLLSYSGVLRRKKTKRYQFTPNTDRCRKIETELDAAIESDSPREQSQGDLDCNLNAMSLGLPVERRNVQNNHPSMENHQTGSFWSQKRSDNSSEIPLVSMQQRPLIVPATLHFSGLRERSGTSRFQEQRRDPPHSEAMSISSDEEVSGDLMDVDYPAKNSNTSAECQQTRQKRQSKRRTHSKPFASKFRSSLAGVFSVRSFLLLASVLLNAYFIVVFTEWPVRIFRSVSDIFRR